MREDICGYRLWTRYLGSMMIATILHGDTDSPTVVFNKQIDMSDIPEQDAYCDAVHSRLKHAIERTVAPTDENRETDITGLTAVEASKNIEKHINSMKENK